MARAEVFKLLPSDDERHLPRLFNLSRNQYDVVIMFHKGIAEPSHVDVAKGLGIPVGTVKSRLDRGRKRIVKWRAEESLKDTLAS